MRVRLLTALLATVATTMAATVAAAPPAAAATITVAGSSGVLYGDCADYDYTWTVGTGARDWSLDVTLIGPDGSTASSDYESGTYATSGTGSFFLCGSDGPGTYRIEAELTDYGSSYSTKTVPRPPRASRCAGRGVGSRSAQPRPDRGSTAS